MEKQERNRLLIERALEQPLEELKAMQCIYLAAYDAIVEISSRRLECNLDDAKNILNDIMQENYNELRETMDLGKALDSLI